MRRTLLLIVLTTVAAAAQDQPLAFVAGRTNLAAGKSVVLAPEATYRLTHAGDSDATDLTDGQITKREDQQIWFDAGAVGYQFSPYFRWKIDLGQVAAIDEVAVRFLGGAAQGAICFPQRVVVWVSDDGEAWHQAASFEKSTESMAAFPPEEGQAWVAPLRFTGLRTRGRYVGFEGLAGGSMTCADELFVFAGDHNAAAVTFQDEARSFATGGVIPYLEKPVFRYSTNVATYGSIGCLDLRPEAERDQPVTVTITLSGEMHLDAARFPGMTIYSERSDAKRPDDMPEPEFDHDRAGGGNSWSFTCNARTERSWGIVFFGGKVGGDHLEGTLDVAWDGGWNQLQIPFEGIEIPLTRRPEKLLTNMGWVGIETARLWPDFLTAYGQLGFRLVPVFARWHHPNDPKSQEVYAFLNKCRDAGYAILDMESPIHDMLAKQKNNPEVQLLDKDGQPTGRFNPAYRGDLYQQAIQSAVDHWAPTRAEYVFFDIEWWSWRGPYGCEDDPLCQRRKAELGIAEWDEFLKVMGHEMMADLVGAYRQKATQIGVDPQSIQFGGYDFEAGKVYQNVWDYDRLYPELLSFAQPSWYTPLTDYNLRDIREKAQENRAHLNGNHLVPWLTPGDSGEYDSRRLTWALTELFAAGAEGFTFWSGRTWDPDDFRAVARAVHRVLPYEDLILNGTPRPEPLTTSGPGQAWITVQGQRALVAVTAYGTTGAPTTTVTLPAGIGGAVTDADSGEVVATVAAGGSFEVSFEADRCVLFGVGTP